MCRSCALRVFMFTEVVTGQKGRRCHFGPLRGLFKMLRRHRKKKSRINDEVVPGGVCVVRAKSTTALNYSVHGDDSLTCDRCVEYILLLFSNLTMVMRCRSGDAPCRIVFLHAHKSHHDFRLAKGIIVQELLMAFLNVVAFTP